LQKAASGVLSEVTLVVPDPLRDYLTTAPVYVSKSGAPVLAQRDLPSMIRHAIRAARKIRIAYQDGDGRSTGRVIPELGLLPLGDTQSLTIQFLGGFGIPLLQQQLAFLPVPRRGLPRARTNWPQLSGGYFYHQRPRAPNPIAADLKTQEELLALVESRPSLQQ
jgi:hypothetical protein